MNSTIGVIVHESIKYDYSLTIIAVIMGCIVAFLHGVATKKNKILKQKLYEVIEMDELKRQTMEILKLLEQDMVERIKEAEKSGEGIDLMSRNAKVMECLAKLDTAHTEAKLRTSNKKSGWFK